MSRNLAVTRMLVFEAYNSWRCNNMTGKQIPHTLIIRLR